MIVGFTHPYEIHHGADFAAGFQPAAFYFLMLLFL
jgi:hypothetical protein